MMGPSTLEFTMVPPALEPRLGLLALQPTLSF